MCGRWKLSDFHTEANLLVSKDIVCMEQFEALSSFKWSMEQLPCGEGH